MRITVADAISPSYFVAIAAVQLGFFKMESTPSSTLADGSLLAQPLQPQLAGYELGGSQ